MKPSVRASLIQERGYRKDIKGDSLSLYLSNSPVAAHYLAQRIGDSKKVLIELCCGIGVTLEILAPKFKRVIGVEKNKRILEACRNNLRTTGISNKVRLIHGDIREKNLIRSLSGDVVIYDIPYWYPEKYHKYTVNVIDAKNPDLKTLIQEIRKYITRNIVIFGPPNLNYKILKRKIGKCECLKININGKHDRNYIFLGKLIKKEGTVLVEL